MRRYPRRITLRLRKRPTYATDFPGYPGGPRRHRMTAQQNFPVGGRIGHLFQRTPKRRAPLAGPLLSASAAGTEKLIDPPDGDKPSERSDASTTPSESMKLSSLQAASPVSLHCPSMKLNGALIEEANLEDSSDQLDTSKESSPKSAVRGHSSSPSSAVPATVLVDGQSNFSDGEQDKKSNVSAVNTSSHPVANYEDTPPR